MRDLDLKCTVAVMSRLVMFGILMCFLTSAIGFGPERVPVSQEQALEFVMKQFPGRNADYYFVDVPDGNYSWFIFVDVNPNAGWEHECYMAVVDRETAVFPLSSYVPVLHEMRHPPEENMTVLKSAGLSRSISDGIPNVPHYQISESQLSTGNRTWAIIIDGGVNKNSHYIRHWNNCAYIYRVLRRKYGIPKTHISVLMSDGTDPGDDRVVFVPNPKEPEKSSVRYESSPLDLDEDGIADIEHPASKAAVKSVLESLKHKVQPGDHILLFVTDHGGRVGETDTQYICLWNNEKLYDHELSELLEPFSENGTILDVVLGQCYSGGFIEDLAMPGSVVSAACSGSETTMGNESYSYFLYYWTMAISERDKDGDELFDRGIDYNVNLSDAFDYAKSMSGGSIELGLGPKYQSIPTTLGRILGFYEIPPLNDIYIKDDVHDIGAEPNNTTTIFWDSPSIWVRNEDDGIEEHENPYFGAVHRKCTVYIKIHNRGLQRYEGGQFAHLYWSKASLNFSDKSWKGLEKYNNLPTGGHAGSVQIPPIEPGGSTVVKIEWDMGDIILAKIPDDFDRHHFCLLAKIMDTRDDDGYENGYDYFCPEFSRKQAQKNVTIILREELDAQKLVFVRNAYDSPRKYSIELRPRTQLDERIYNKADIEIELSQPVYNAWIKGGANACNTTQSSVAPRVFKFTSPESRIDAISMDGSQFDKMGMKFDFHSSTILGDAYKLDLIQRDEDGVIVGGETFIVQSPKKVLIPFAPEIKAIGSNTFMLSVDNAEVSNLVWRNSAGEVISRSDSVIVRPSVSECSYTVAGLTEDGNLVKSEISLDTLIGIESVVVSDNIIHIKLRSAAANGDRLVFAEAIDVASSLEVFVDEGLKEVVVDSSLLHSGILTVRYISGDMVIDTMKFNK